MKNTISYKNFIGTINYSPEDNVLFGKVEGINDLITFEGKSVDEIKKNFYEAVDDYLELCKRTGKEVHKSLKGSFNVRISPEIHYLADQKAKQLRISLNQLVQKAIKRELKSSHTKFI